MKIQNYKLLFLLLFMLTIFGCYKDDVNITEEVIVEYPDVVIEETNVAGIFRHSNAHIIQGNNIEFAGMQSQSSFPYFFFKAKNINQNFEILSYRNDDGLNLYYPLNNVANNNNIHDIIVPHEFNPIETVSNSLIISNLDYDISLNGINFIKDGNDHQAPEILFTRLQDHTLPGNMQGISAEEKPMIIESQNIFYVGWSDEEITAEVQSVLIKDSDELLYFLDNITGEWNLHNQRTFLAGFYAIGNEIPAINAEILVNDAQDLDGNTVVLSTEYKSYNRQRLSNTQKLNLFLPKVSDFQLTIENSKNIRHNETYQTAENIDITVDNDIEISLVNIEAKDCVDDDLLQSIIQLEASNYKKIFLSEKGSFRIPRPEGNKLESSVISHENTLTSSTISLPIKPNIDIGRQFVCDQIEDEYMYFLTEGHKSVLSNINSLFQANDLSINASMMSTTFSINLRQIVEGNLQDEKANIFFNAPDLAGGYRLNCMNSDEGCGFEKLTITHLGTESGDYIKGKFEGKFWIESLAQSDVGDRAMKGEFQIKVQ